MNGNNSLAILTRAAEMLQEADTIQKTKELKSLALTAADWARRKGMGEATIAHCRSYALEAERKMGGLLLATNRAKGVRINGKSKGNIGGNVVLPPMNEPTLQELGISKRESSEAQKLAQLSEALFRAVVNGTKTRTQVKRERQRAKASAKASRMPEGKFRVIYADPPWKYGDGLTEKYGPARFQYPSMTITELCSMPIEEKASDDAVLFLWVTSPMLAECWPVIKAWGFKYKASFVWDKVKHNMGHYNSVRHELLLLCTRGSCLPEVPTLIDSVQSIERSDKHSEKPARFREIIETLYPNGNKLELFARTKADGWSSFGNEC